MSKPIKPALLSILVLSMILNTWGNHWGAPEHWHPDELVQTAEYMVKNRTLEPGRYHYGGSQYSILALGVVVPVKIVSRAFDPKPAAGDVDAIRKWRDREVTRMTVLSRTVSALMATSLILVTFVTASLLFGPLAGLLSSLFLSVTPYFVAVAHFATIDTPANLWFWLAALFALLYWKCRSKGWLVAAAIVAGWAVGTKFDRAIILLPLMLSIGLSRDRAKVKQALFAGAFMLLGYVAANPALVIAPFAFLDGTIRDLSFNLLRDHESGGGVSFKLVGAVYSGLGLPLFVCSSVGMVYGLFNFAINEKKAEVGWLFACIAPYVLLFSSNQAEAWYAPFLFPGFAMFAAYLFAAALRRLHGFWNCVSIALICLVFAYSLLLTVAFNAKFTNDSRYEAAHWVERHAPRNATIAIGPRGPHIDQQLYRVVVRRPETGDFAAWRQKLERSESYARVRRAVSELEAFVARVLNRPVRERHYVAWFDRLPNTEDVDDLELQGNSPDFLVLLESQEPARLARLYAPTSGYALLARFPTEMPTWPEVTFPFVSPHVVIFGRLGAP